MSIISSVSSSFSSFSISLLLFICDFCLWDLLLLSLLLSYDWDDNWISITGLLLLLLLLITLELKFDAFICFNFLTNNLLLDWRIAEIIWEFVNP